MAKSIIIASLISIVLLSNSQAIETPNYEVYHKQVIEAEKLIASENYNAALDIYIKLFEDYSFIFLREYQVASQLALYQKNKPLAKQFIKYGILSGWSIKAIKRNDFIKEKLNSEDWSSIKEDYCALRKQYELSLNCNLKQQIRKMYSKDQWNALKVLFRFSSKSQDKYAERKFAPHSEKQMASLFNILNVYGYPGEKLIGNNEWMSIILSHHNSISTAYNTKDELYPNLKLKLKEALKNGQISPPEFALIDDWYLSVKHNRKIASYGFLNLPSQSQIPKANKLREIVFLRSIELRDALLSIQNKTGMDFYLPAIWY